MANRIVGNVYTLDSSTGITNKLVIGTSSSWMSNTFVSAFCFVAADTTSEIELVFASATDTTAYIEKGIEHTKHILWSSFGQPVPFTELRLKTLTAGTGMIYFV